MGTIKTKKHLGVSIIIPTFNRIEKLKKCINSIHSQSFNKYEIIIVDNKSTDNTEKYIKKNFKKIKFFSIKNNGSIAKSRNLGIKKSYYDNLAFIDSDDIWFEKKLELSMKYIYENYDLVYHDMVLQKKNKLFSQKISYTRNLNKNNYEKDLIFNGPAFATSSVVLKKKFFFKIKYFNENQNYIAWEDYDAWIRMSKYFKKVKRISESLGSVLRDDENYSNDYYLSKNINTFLKKYIKKKRIPNWCLISLIKINFKKKNYIKVINLSNKIKLNRIDIKLIFIIFLIKMTALMIIKYKEFNIYKKK